MATDRPVDEPVDELEQEAVEPKKFVDQPKRPEDLNSPYFTLREAAWLRRCSVKTVRRRIKDGTLPHSRRRNSEGKPTGRILVSREDLDHLYDADRVGAAPAPRRGRARSAPQRAA
ncbi:helix-turn-helix domain-containing protein [Streptomyces sp. NPDC047315]|uniref:helix-turn-helix domain-containing protein n=1 Tax=Streptomyces sp. NPDC047315 TaxID=3155142 RepID=UPI0033DC2F9E